MRYLVIYRKNYTVGKEDSFYIQEYDGDLKQAKEYFLNSIYDYNDGGILDHNIISEIYVIPCKDEYSVDNIIQKVTADKLCKIREVVERYNFTAEDIFTT